MRKADSLLALSQFVAESECGELQFIATGPGAENALSLLCAAEAPFNPANFDDDGYAVSTVATIPTRVGL